jgi:hypothetical protein
VTTVFGRSDDYYRYTDADERPDRLRADVASNLASLNYVKLSADERVSRTHGMIDPVIPAICDLNSTNGVLLNHREIPTCAGEAGPMVALSHNDRIQIGRAVFEASVTTASEEELLVRVRAQRFGFVGSDLAGRERASAVKTFLIERKGFAMRDAVGWQAAIANLFRLQQSAHAEGVAVCALFAEIKGSDLLLNGEPMNFTKLLPLLANIDGRKVLVLEGRGDPAACEQLFEAMAFEDSVMITSGGPPDELGDDSDLIVPSLQSREMKRMRESLDGGSLAGAFDDAIDGIDALLSPDTNILKVAWIATYDGRIKVTFGSREQSEDHALSHSLRLGSSTFRF